LHVDVPTGACGNITAGLIAKQMGLNIDFVSSLNVNNVLEKCIVEGVYERKESKNTLSCAMDIGLPCNVPFYFIRHLSYYFVCSGREFYIGFLRTVEKGQQSL